MRSHLQSLIVTVAIALLAASVESRDFVEGSENANNVLIHTANFEGLHFEWRGINQISRFEVRNRAATNQSGWDWWQLGRSGGVRSNFLRLWADDDAVPLNIEVRIFSRPQNQSMGWQSDESSVVSTTRLTGVAPYNLTFWSPLNAVQVELVDLTNGTGAHAVFGHLGRRGFSGQITSELFRGQFDFNMIVHGEPVRPNHFTSGRLLNTSVQINSDLITADSLSDDGMLTYLLPNHTFNYVRFTDLTDGTAGRVLRTWAAWDRLSVQFEPEQNTTFLMQVHGTPLFSRNIIVGELRANSELLERRVIRLTDRSQTIVLRPALPVDRIEVLNLETYSRAEATLVNGEVGGQLVVVVIEARVATWMNFEIKVYGSAR